jgi:tetratricopeptide (TPR) repeat protein
MEAKRSYLAVLEEGEPRAEILCTLGACFLAEGDLHAACLWYRAALLCRMPAQMLAFIQPDAYGYIPLMQLCVIYDRMGRMELAAEMNERALTLHPGDAAATANRAYFARVLQKTEEEESMEIDGQEA